MTRPFCVRTRPCGRGRGPPRVLRSGGEPVEHLAVRSVAQIRAVLEMALSPREGVRARCDGLRFERGRGRAADLRRHYGRDVSLEVDFFDHMGLQAKDLPRARGRSQGPKRRDKRKKRSEQGPPGHVE